MFISRNLFFLIFTIVVQCQNITVRFPSVPMDTDIGSCTCDLTQGQCDASCCCDSDCSADDRESFACSSRENQYTNSTPVISTVQPSCFKNLSIFQSNSPYIIQKMGELVCVDYARYKGSQYYQKPVVQTLDPSAFIQAINTQYGVSAPYQLANNLKNYQVGTPILADTASSNTSIYSLPMGLFNNPVCAGSRAITYMNDFTSTCSQTISNSICTTGALNPTTYTNSLRFIGSPSGRNDASARISVNVTGNASAATFSGGVCFNALRSLTVIIYYQNPSGIVAANVILSTENANANSTLFEQTFTVKFLKNGQSPSTATSNPGYQQGAVITIGHGNGSAIDLVDSSTFSILKPSASGVCDTVIANRIPIRFGQNVQSTCRYPVSPPFNTLPNQFLLTDSSNLYVAAYSNSDPLNTTRDWLPVILCSSDVGASNTRDCSSTNISATLSTKCYIRLDIQIAYTNIGSTVNPQAVLSAVIFHYQSLPDCPTTSTNLLLMESVTFQDISSTPITEQGQIPTPNTRLPANFFYPFSVSQGTKSMTFSSFFSLLIAVLLTFI